MCRALMPFAALLIAIGGCAWATRLDIIPLPDSRQREECRRELTELNRLHPHPKTEGANPGLNKTAIEFDDSGSRVRLFGQWGYANIDTDDPVTSHFLKFAPAAPGKILEWGCGLGLPSIKALEAGATCVMANDVERADLWMVATNTPTEHLGRLQLVLGRFPHLKIEPNSLRAVYGSRGWHFLKPDEFELSVKRSFEWLEPGGHLYLVEDGVHLGGDVKEWHDSAYQDALNNHVFWPGFISDLAKHFPRRSATISSTDFLHLLDPYIIHRTLVNAGFIVGTPVRRRSIHPRSAFSFSYARGVGYFPRPTYPEEYLNGGWEGVGAIGVKPYPKK